MFRVRFLVDVVFPALVMCWAAILLYSAVAGESGYGALASAREDVAALQSEVDALQARRISMEKRADMLNSRSLDPDIIDEQIRRTLGFAREGDFVIDRADLNALLAEQKRKRD